MENETNVIVQLTNDEINWFRENTKIKIEYIRYTLDNWVIFGFSGIDPEKRKDCNHNKLVMVKDYKFGMCYKCSECGQVIYKARYDI
jgi:hypothetical protein